MFFALEAWWTAVARGKNATERETARNSAPLAACGVNSVTVFRRTDGATPCRKRTKQLLLVVCGAAWVLAVATGLVVLWDYDAGPAPAGHPPARWPVASRLAQVNTRATLVMTAHPHCPCTRASIGELEGLMTQTAGLVDTYVLFYKPMAVPEGWDHTDLWRRAALIPGVRVVQDDAGAEAERFGALASGQVMLYSAGGDRLFSGGITASRGHAGDNAGRDAIVALLRHQPNTRAVTPVFGCALGETATNSPGPGGSVTLGNILGRIGVRIGRYQ
jgi:hypothetical protein